MKVVLTGARGALGQEFVKQFPEAVPVSDLDRSLDWAYRPGSIARLANSSVSYIPSQPPVYSIPRTRWAS